MLSKLHFSFARLSLALVVLISLVGTFLPASPPTAYALNNGLALTPPMGWNSWNNFGCNVSDTLIRGMVDAMVSSGMAAAGYQYVNIDDCWQNTTRTNGHVTATSSFPGGIQAVADYAHSKGLKLGVYSDHGTATCAGRAGSYSFETTDANDYAAWGVDYLKYDNCNLPAGDNVQQDYVNMKNALAASGRAIVYSICAWNFQTWMPATGNLWRTTGDISDSWSSMMGNYDISVNLASNASPGAWNDPDMLEIGRGGMTDTEYHTHMSLWAIMAAPLIAGNDTRSQTAATSAILEAPEIIAVDQDAAGHQGVKVSDTGNLEIISKVESGTGVRAVALLNRGTTASNITVTWSQIGLASGNATVRDLWAQVDRGTFSNSYTVSVPSHGTAMLKIVGVEGPTPTPTPTSIPATGPSFEAEAGVLSGAAVLASCSACSGGQKVGFIGNGAANYVTITANVSTAGTYQLTTYYMTTCCRDFYVSVNGGADLNLLGLSGPDFNTPQTTNTQIQLNAGNNTLKYHNDSAYGPDLDRIVVTLLSSGPTNTPAPPTNTPTIGPSSTPTRTPTPCPTNKGGHPHC